jgi:hypothetical protein
MTRHGRMLLLVSSLLSPAVAPGCGPSAETLCHELQVNPCPPGKATLVDPYSDCVQNLGSPCAGPYRAYVECQIAHPSCNTLHPDGSMTLDGPITCGDELNKFIACGLGG